MKGKININNLTINPPTKINPDRVLFEIEDYDYESAIVSIEELRKIKTFIDDILEDYDK